MKIAQAPSNQLIRLTIILGLLLIVALIPRQILFDETHSVCIHYWLLGFQCPLCGMTRAVYEMTHLRFATAINYNAVVALLPLYLATDIATLFFKQNWLLQVRKTFLLLIIAGLLMLYAFRIIQHSNFNL